jgi:hypothetical protein
MQSRGGSHASAKGVREILTASCEWRVASGVDGRDAICSECGAVNGVHNGVGFGGLQCIAGAFLSFLRYDSVNLSVPRTFCSC